MNFSEFCGMMSPKNFGYDSQASFLKALFKAASIGRDYSGDYLKLLYKGLKPFSSNIKRHFPRPLNEAAVAEFLKKHFKEEFLASQCDICGIPADWEKNVVYLTSALASQFCAFIRSEEEDIENHVPDAYLAAKMRQETQDYHIDEVLYDGDNVWVEEPYKKHAVNCYECFPHIWVLHNTGKTAWYKRRLVCVNADAIAPRISDTAISLPDVLPNKYIKITTNIEARGCEGHYVSQWEMRDSSDSNCFPHARNVFDITIDVTFNPNNVEV